MVCIFVNDIDIDYDGMLIGVGCHGKDMYTSCFCCPHQYNPLEQLFVQWVKINDFSSDKSKGIVVCQNWRLP